MNERNVRDERGMRGGFIYRLCRAGRCLSKKILEGGDRCRLSVAGRTRQVLFTDAGDGC